MALKKKLTLPKYSPWRAK